MQEDEFTALIAGILEVDPASVQLSDSLDDIDWDSLSSLSFIAEIDERLNISIEADELVRATTVSDLFDLVKSRDQRG